MKKILEEISSTHIFTGFENAAFFPWYVAPEKRAGISNFVKNRVLKSSSNIFFTLVKLWLTKRRSFIPLSFLIYAYYHIDEIFFRNSLLYTSFYEIRLTQLKGTQVTFNIWYRKRKLELLPDFKITRTEFSSILRALTVWNDSRPKIWIRKVNNWKCF